MLSSLVPNGYNPYNGSKSYMARPQLHGPVPSLSPVDINARNSEGETVCCCFVGGVNTRGGEGGQRGAERSVAFLHPDTPPCSRYGRRTTDDDRRLDGVNTNTNGSLCSPELPRLACRPTPPRPHSARSQIPPPPPPPPPLPRQALTFALKNEQLDMIKVLVEKGKADINSQNADGNTELMLAARRGQTRMVKLLVETMGANVHLRNKEGLTALMVAEKYERTEIVRFLRGFVVAGGRVKGRGTGVKGRGTR